jgi:hypothetical protein
MKAGAAGNGGGGEAVHHGGKIRGETPAKKTP